MKGILCVCNKGSKACQKQAKFALNNESNNSSYNCCRVCLCDRSVWSCQLIYAGNACYRDNRVPKVQTVSSGLLFCVSDFTYSFEPVRHDDRFSAFCNRRCMKCERVSQDQHMTVQREAIVPVCRISTLGREEYEYSTCRSAKIMLYKHQMPTPLLAYLYHLILKERHGRKIFLSNTCTCWIEPSNWFQIITKFPTSRSCDR